MNDSTVARAYARAIVELAEGEKIDVAKELTSLSEAVNSSNDFENLLFLDVFTPEEKLNVFSEISKKLGISPLIKNFISFLISEKRINLFPLVFKEVIVRDDERRGFLRGVISGDEDKISKEMMEKIRKILAQHISGKIDLRYEKVKKVSAGLRVQVEDLLLDATLDHQLEQFKRNLLHE